VAIEGVKELQPGRIALSMFDETWLMPETLLAIWVEVPGLNGVEPGGAR